MVSVGVATLGVSVFDRQVISRKDSMASAMRADAFPSQPLGRCSEALLSHLAANAARIGPLLRTRTSRFVPCPMVIGRSIVERSPRQGTPKTVLPSCIPLNRSSPDRRLCERVASLDFRPGVVLESFATRCRLHQQPFADWGRKGPPSACRRGEECVDPHVPDDPDSLALDPFGSEGSHPRPG